MTLAARLKFHRVPAWAPAKRKAVDRRCAQLVADESTAYGLVAKMSSFPVRMRAFTVSEIARILVVEQN